MKRVTEGHEVRGPKGRQQGEVLGEGAVSPFSPARGPGGLGSVVSSPSGVRPPSDLTTFEVLRKASFLIAQEA